MIRDTKTYPFIMDLLDSIPEEAGGLAVNWQLFCSNNQTNYEAKPLKLRRNRCQEGKHVKTIVRTNRVRKRSHNPHFPQYFGKNKSVDTNGEIVEGRFNERKPRDVLVLNHYQCKSVE